MGVHTFAPELHGERRNADVGLLYDPRREWEKRVVDRMTPALSAQGFRVRRNYPYRGDADGHTTSLRRLYPDGKYAGIEIEINQALLPQWKQTVQRLQALAPAALLAA